MKNLFAENHSSNAVKRTIKVPIALMIGRDVMEGPIVRMVMMKWIVRREHVLHKNSIVIMEDVSQTSGCGKQSFLFVELKE